MNNQSIEGTVRSREQRRRFILDVVIERGQATALELAGAVGRSPMTIRRDIDELAQRGLVRKFHGGVSALPTSSFEASSEFRQQVNVNAKIALANVAVGLIEPGMSLLLDDSTTALNLAKILRNIGPLTVLTNYRPTIDVLIGFEEVRVISIGGTYSKTHDSFIGSPHSTWLPSYAVDICFQSTSTMDAQMTYHQEEDQVVMKRGMFEAGNRKVLMMDSSKVGRTSLHKFLPVSAFSDLILTRDTPLGLFEELPETTVLHVA